MDNVKIELPQNILNAFHPIFQHAVQKFTRNGIVLEKGAELSDKRIEKNKETYESWYDYFFWYPDRFLDLIQPRSSKFHLFLYQRIFLRACVRYPRVCCIACRAFSKSFLSVIALYLMCIFRPGTKVFICAPGKAQGAKIRRREGERATEIIPFTEK